MKRFSLFLLLAFFSFAVIQPTWADNHQGDRTLMTKKKKKKRKGRYLASPGNLGAFHFGLGIAALSATGTNGVGINLGVFLKTGKRSKTYVGLHTGFDLVKNGGFGILGGGGGIAAGLPLLAAVYKEMKARAGEKAIPYMGFAIGPYIGLSKIGTFLAMFFKPGMLMPLSRSVRLAVETTFGSIDGGFYFFPHGKLVLRF